MSRIDALLSAMTIEEKIGQLNMVASTRAVTGPGDIREDDGSIRAGRIGSVLNLWGASDVRRAQRLAVKESRLGIPLLICHDVIHGHRTIFPVPLAEACAFDPHLWEKTARVAAQEASEDGITLTFAPMLDIGRDPRWGRIVEGPGEDPWVASQIARAKTIGYQGSDLASRQCIAATAKHFGAYGAVTAGREYASAEVSERTLREIYLPAFAAAIEAGVAAIMPAFNDIAGMPMTINAALLQGELRERLSFEGVVISDYNAIAELLNHGVARDIVEAASLALKAGVDIDMTSNAYLEGLPVALSRGLISIEEINASVRRVLILKERLGLFENPDRSAPPAVVTDATRHERRSLSREAARRSIVLLTNKDGILPLLNDIQRLALIGPLVDAREPMLGSWASAGHEEPILSISDGLRQALPTCHINVVSGVTIDGEGRKAIDEARACAQKAQVIILCIGENAEMSGEAASRVDIGLPGEQQALAQAMLSLGKPVIALLTSGRPLVAPWLFERADAVLATWSLGSEAGAAIADVVLGRFNPGGKLPVSWPRHVGQAPLYYSQRPTGRPTQVGVHYSSCYIDSPATPQFPFGHGLSYSVFTLHDLVCKTPLIKLNDRLQICVSVRNESAEAGEATIFFFIRDLVASVARPVLELKGVQKLYLEAGKCENIVWSLPARELAFVGQNLESVIEAGDFQIFVGQSAAPESLIVECFKVIL